MSFEEIKQKWWSTGTHDPDASPWALHPSRIIVNGTEFPESILQSGHLITIDSEESLPVVDPIVDPNEDDNNNTVFSHRVLLLKWHRSISPRTKREFLQHRLKYKFSVELDETKEDSPHSTSKHDLFNTIKEHEFCTLDWSVFMTILEQQPVKILPQPTMINQHQYQTEAMRIWLQALYDQSVATQTKWNDMLEHILMYQFQFNILNDTFFTIKYADCKPFQWNETIMSRNSMWGIDDHGIVHVMVMAMPTQDTFISHESQSMSEGYHHTTRTKFEADTTTRCVLSAKEDGSLFRVSFTRRDHPLFQKWMQFIAKKDDPIHNAIAKLSQDFTQGEYVMAWHSNAVPLLTHKETMDVFVVNSYRVLHLKGDEQKEREHKYITPPDAYREGLHEGKTDPLLHTLVTRYMGPLALSLIHKKEIHNLTMAFEVSGEELRSGLTVLTRKPMFRFLGVRVMMPQYPSGLYLPHYMPHIQTSLKKYNIKDPQFWVFDSTQTMRTFLEYVLMLHIMAPELNPLPRSQNYFQENFHALEGFVIEVDHIFFKYKLDMYLICHCPWRPYVQESMLQRLAGLPEHVRDMLPVAQQCYEVMNVNWPAVVHHILSLYALYEAGLVEEQDYPKTSRKGQEKTISKGVPLLCYWYMHVFQWINVVDELGLPKILEYMPQNMLIGPTRNAFQRKPFQVKLQLKKLFYDSSHQ